MRNIAIINDAHDSLMPYRDTYDPLKLTINNHGLRTTASRRMATPRKAMKVKLLFIMLTTLCVQPCLAKEYDHTVQGWVRDNMTGEGIPEATVILMTEDSIPLDTVKTLPKEAYDFVGMYQFTIRKVGRYILKAMSEGYDDGYSECRLRSNREINLFPKEIRMTKVSHELPEVLVRATKVKMVLKGDTIIYNADAFNLAEGSMLDALVSRLPGAKLTKDGRIYVNGEYVQSLLVNGKDFFSGNPKIALENLPAYTINKIKVYKKAGAMSMLAGKDMNDKSLVMDVRLKKEYSTGYMGNIEAGTGTDNRYTGRLFGMKFSDMERLGIFGNINNVNDNQRARLDGDWTPQDVPSGLLRTQNYGLSYIHFLGDESSWISSDNTYSHTDADNMSRTSTQTFLPGGDSYQKSESQQTTKNTQFDTKNNIYLQKFSQGYYLIGNLNFSYADNKGWGNSLTETSDTTLQNSMLAQSSNHAKQYNFTFNHSGGRAFISDYLRWEFTADYEHTKTEDFSLLDTKYIGMTNADGSMARDYRNNYLHRGGQQWNLKANASYSITWPDKTIAPDYEYKYRFNKADNMLYRLDKLTGRDSTRLDMLPSARKNLINVLDQPNSYSYRQYDNSHRFRLYISQGGISDFFNEYILYLPLRLAHSNLNYYRQGMHHVSRNALFFEPSLTLKGTVFDMAWEMNADISSDFPDLTTMVDYRDDSNPLNVFLGNPDLKNTHTYNASLSLRNGWEGQRMFTTNIAYHKRDNAVAYGLIYDRATGVTTTKPQSINGNWDASLRIGHSTPLDSMQRWTMDNQFTASYIHSVDLAGEERSIVGNYQIGDVFKLNFRPNDNYEFSLHAGGNYNFIHSRRDGFKNIHAGDYNIGFNTTLNLPWKLQLTTDITMFARRGYQSSEMNTTDWVWNAHLSRSFFKGRLTTKLLGFDILHELSTTQYNVNEQGRTESWHNSLPRYAMLSVSWRFNHNPKSK